MCLRYNARMAKAPLLISNPGQIPSVPWAEYGLMLPEWDASQWQALDRQTIRAALTHATLAHAEVAPYLWMNDGHVVGSRPASVLVLLIESDTGFEVVLTTRAAHMRHHAGQVSFVGGQQDAGETPAQTALREAFEEIHLDVDVVDVLGAMPLYQTITGFSVTPIVAIIPQNLWQKQKIQLNHQEVDQLFLTPLAHVFDRHLLRVHRFSSSETAGNPRYFLSTTYRSAQSEFFIWGASMAILHNLDLILRAELKF